MNTLFILSAIFLAPAFSYADAQDIAAAEVTCAAVREDLEKIASFASTSCPSPKELDFFAIDVKHCAAETRLEKRQIITLFEVILATCEEKN